MTFALWIMPPGEFEGGYECENTLDLHMTVAAAEESKTPINQTIPVQGSYYAEPSGFRHCPYCGTELNLPETPGFCSQCGKPLTD